MAKFLLLYRCYVKEEAKGEELAVVHYMEFVPPLDGVDKILGSVCLQ